MVHFDIHAFRGKGQQEQRIVFERIGKRTPELIRYMVDVIVSHQRMMIRDPSAPCKSFCRRKDALSGKEYPFLAA